MVEGKVLDVEEIKEISKLPNREGMYSMLLGMLQAPVSKFARVVKAVAEAKENGSEAVAKVVREITGLGLVDAKGLVDKVPSVIKENIPAAEGAEIKEKLEAAGATVEVK